MIELLWKFLRQFIILFGLIWIHIFLKNIDWFRLKFKGTISFTKTFTNWWISYGIMAFWSIWKYMCYILSLNNTVYCVHKHMTTFHAYGISVCSFTNDALYMCTPVQTHYRIHVRHQIRFGITQEILSFFPLKPQTRCTYKNIIVWTHWDGTKIGIFMEAILFNTFLETIFDLE